jgi:TRAP-type C4-dicarboxylate transport system substrate-binding protein
MHRGVRLLQVAAALVVHVAAPAAAQTRWDLPSAYPPGNFHTQNLVQFAADVKKASGGKLEITVHPNASLFKAPEIKRVVQGGQAALGEVLLVNFENFRPLYGLDGIPFLANGYPEALRLYQASRAALEKQLASEGLVLLYAVPWPPQGIFTKKPIQRVADMRGIKWRAYSPMTARIADLVGAQPVTVQAAELSQALATGVVQSYLSSSSTGYDSKTYEHLRYFYDTRSSLPKNAVLVNRRALAALEAPVREALLAAAREAEARGWKLSEEKDGWYKKALAEKGMQILAPSTQLTADFRQVGQTMLSDWLKKVGAPGQAILDAYRRP